MSSPEDSRPRWRAADLLAAAAAEGLAASRKLIQNWVEEGLLDRPYVRGRGPGQGVEGLWSENQRRLFVELLRLAARQEVRRNAPLANVPVWLWLRYGDDYVPLRQVRRALRTWAVPARNPPVSSAEATARSLVSRLADPKAPRRAVRRFRTFVARGQAGEQVTKEELAAAARPVLDPSGTGRARGPVGAQVDGRLYGDYVEAMLAGADAVIKDRGGEDLPEFILHRAREMYRRARTDYSARRADFARDPELGHLHTDASMEAEVVEACRDLIQLVGYLLVSTDWRRRRVRRSHR